MAGHLLWIKTDCDHYRGHVCELYQYVAFELWIHMKSC